MFFKDDKKVKLNNSAISTYIGVDTKVEGTVISNSGLRIDGSVIGGVCAKGTVVLSGTGQIQGNVIADNIVVAGVVDGNMKITEKTNIEPTGEVYGDISTGSILIDEASVFQGKCNMNREKDRDSKKRLKFKKNDAQVSFEANQNVDKGKGKPTAEKETEAKSEQPADKETKSRAEQPADKEAKSKAEQPADKEAKSKSEQSADKESETKKE